MCCSPLSVITMLMLRRYFVTCGQYQCDESEALGLTSSFVYDGHAFTRESTPVYRIRIRIYE